VSRAFPSQNRSILTEIYLCHACSHHEIEDGNARTGTLEDADAASWKFYNLAREHNAACGSDGCGVNSTYDSFTAGIANASTSVVGGKAVHISPWRWTHHNTPPMTKAYFGLEAPSDCNASSSRCDFFVSYGVCACACECERECCA
jgi:hypothetical protein